MHTYMQCAVQLNKANAVATFGACCCMWLDVVDNQSWGRQLILSSCVAVLGWLTGCSPNSP